MSVRRASRVIVEVQAWVEMSAPEWDCIAGRMALRQCTFGDSNMVCH
jgi:hypothetical protein